MSKAILISIKPEWVFKILNGDKTIEIRKTLPKCDLPIDVYIYCTKTKTELYGTDKGFVLTDFGIGSYFKNKKLCNGKVVAKFTLNKVETIWKTKTEENPKHLLKNSCLSFEELSNYLNGNVGYAWHIDNLEIFDKPKDLNAFSSSLYWSDPFLNHGLRKAPQSWCYIEKEIIDNE